MALDRARYGGSTATFPVAEVAPVVGMSPTFIRRVLGNSQDLSVQDVLTLLDQDAFGETFVPRSRALDYLINSIEFDGERVYELSGTYDLVREDCLSFAGREDGRTSSGSCSRRLVKRCPHVPRAPGRYVQGPEACGSTSAPPDIPAPLLRKDVPAEPRSSARYSRELPPERGERGSIPVLG